MPAPDWIADPIAGHTHHVDVPLPPERALAHALGTPVAPDHTVRTLFRLRGLDPGGTLEDFFDRRDLGFLVLERAQTFLTGGVAMQVWPPSRHPPTLDDPEGWPDWGRRPGTVRAALDFRVSSATERAGGWSRITTETRVDASDRAARRLFEAYWLAVRRPSELIRRRWLSAIAKRARRVAPR